jgi:hypothetical protein
VFGHAPANPLAHLMIYCMCGLGVVIAAFGVYCLVIGIKQWFK